MSQTRTIQRRRAALSISVSAAMLATGGALTFAGAAPLAPLHGTIRVVHESDMSWVEQAYECSDGGADLTPRQATVAGPQRAPFGSGSHRSIIGPFTVQTELYRTPIYDGTPLADITRLEYSTYATPRNSTGAARQLPYLRINVDDNNDGLRDASLFFFPSNNGDQHAIVNGHWQHWNVGTGNVNVDGDTGPGSATTLAAYATAHPGSRLVNNNGGDPTGGSIATIVGCAQGGNDDSFRNGTYFTDRVIVGKFGQDTLYDFEPATTETHAGTVTRVVDPNHLQGWVHQAYDAVTNADYVSNQKFVRGPGTPPLGVGSLRFGIGSNSNRVELFRTRRYDNRLLRDLRGLGYATYQHASGTNTADQQPAYLRLNLDNNGDGARDESLFFIPADNPRQGAIQQNTWQSWNAYRGRWSIGGDQGSGATVTLRSYLVAHPDSRIVNNDTGLPDGGGFAVIVGASGANQHKGHFFVDKIIVRTVDAATSTTVSGSRFDLQPVTG